MAMSFDPAAGDSAMTSEKKDAKPTDSRAAFVKKLQKEVEGAKKHWSKRLKKMRECMDFAEGNHWTQRTGDELDPEQDGRLKADIIQRHIASRTAALYARNPTPVAKRKERLDFAIWDGSEDALQQLGMRLQEAAMMGGMPSPADQALLMDIAEGMQRRKMVDKLGKTVTLLVKHSLDAQEPTFKSQVKSLVTRVLTCGVGYVRTGYQRVLKKRVDDQAALHDVTQRLAILTRLRDELAEGEIDTYSPDIEEAMILRTQLESSPEVLAREGVVYTFPCATAVFPDKRCKSLIGFVGSRFIVEEHLLDDDDIEETFGVNIEGKATPYTVAPNGTIRKDQDCDEPVYRVYEVFHKQHGVVYWICEGYDDFLQEPETPEAFNEQFWNHRAVIFNRPPSTKNPFPRSDVELLMQLQREINRTLEALRQHRIASRPTYVSAKGMISPESKAKLTGSSPHELVELDVNPGTDINTVLMQIKKAAIDPNIYTLDPIYDAIMRVSGSSEANLGGTANATATESSISEASRLSALSSNADDMDDLLSAVAKDTAQLHMRETAKETVLRVVGKGAVWFDFPVEDIIDELDVNVRAGSSGRPNADRTLAKLERAAPILLQLPGVKGEPIAQILIDALDEGWDLEEFYDPHLPSITAQNANAQPGTGDPASDPNMQGQEGGQNDPRAIEGRPGPQPAYLPSPNNVRTLNA